MRCCNTVRNRTKSAEHHRRNHDCRKLHHFDEAQRANAVRTPEGHSPPRDVPRRRRSGVQLSTVQQYRSCICALRRTRASKKEDQAGSDCYRYIQVNHPRTHERVGHRLLCPLPQAVKLDWRDAGLRARVSQHLRALFAVATGHRLGAKKIESHRLSPRGHASLAHSKQ